MKILLTLGGASTMAPSSNRVRRSHVPTEAYQAQKRARAQAKRESRAERNRRLQALTMAKQYGGKHERMVSS